MKMKMINDEDEDKYEDEDEDEDLLVAWNSGNKEAFLNVVSSWPPDGGHGADCVCPAPSSFPRLGQTVSSGAGRSSLSHQRFSRELGAAPRAPAERIDPSGREHVPEVHRVSRASGEDDDVDDEDREDDDYDDSLQVVLREAACQEDRCRGGWGGEQGKPRQNKGRR